MNMEVKYTMSRSVLAVRLGPPRATRAQDCRRDSNLRVPVGAVWKLLPWNKARRRAVKLVYFDGDMRIVEDPSGDLFVYIARRALPPLPTSDSGPGRTQAAPHAGRARLCVCRLRL